MRAVPYIAFFLSGATSLIFQALWTRMLHHTFGASSVAISSVLSVFMGGLGLGAYVSGKLRIPPQRALVLYAIAELAIGAWALGVPALVHAEGPLASISASLREALGEHGAAPMLARFACIVPVLLVPTTLMGATLPLLARHVTSVRGERARVAALYAVNTLGAVSGTLLGSFLLMPKLGVQATNQVAVAINAALALSVLCFSPRARAPTWRAPVAGSSGARGAPARRLGLIVFGISGACAMAYEVVWSRALALALGSSLQAFALILVTFLLGIAGGSALCALVLGRPRILEVWAMAGLSALLSVLALAPAMLLAGPAVALVALGLAATLLAAAAATVAARGRELSRAGGELAEEALRMRERAGRRMLLVPVLLAAIEVVRAVSERSRIDPVALHGYLPYVAAVSVLACALAIAVPSALRRKPLALAAGVQVTIALGTLASYAVQDEIPYGFARLVGALDELPENVGLVRSFMLLTAGLCTLPAALGMGAMFPVTLALCGHAPGELAGDTGRAIGANTLGAIAGAWLPGFVLLPQWGMERTLLAGIAVNAALALALACAGETRERRSRASRPLAAVAAVVLGIALAQAASPRPPLAWNLAHMTVGAFRVALARDVLDRAAWGEPELLYYRDGVATTVTVERWKHHLMLKNNGKVDASNGDDMPTQVMVAAYPLLLHPRGARDLEVAIIGFGSGVTVGSALAFPLGRLDVVELEDAVVDAASRYFGDVSHLVRSLERFPYVRAPRLRLHHDDGRNFLARSKRRYDVIVSEPSNPWITGVSDLFTVEHFALAKRRLAPGGIYCQWVQLYELSPENIKTIYRTFASQFRHVIAFAAEERSSDTILLGSDGEIPLDLDALARALAAPEVARELARADVPAPGEVLGRVLFASREEIMTFATRELRDGRAVADATGIEACAPPGCRREPVALNTDDNMRIELRAPADLIGFARYAGYTDLFYGPDWPFGRIAPHVRGGGPAARLELALSLLSHGRRESAAAMVADLGGVLEAGTRGDALAVSLSLAEGPEPLPDLGPALWQVPLGTPRRIELAALRRAGEAAFSRGDFRHAADLLAALPLPLRRLGGPDLHFRYALALYRAAHGARERLAEAASELELLARRDPTYAGARPEVHYYLARALFALGQSARAVRAMRTYTGAVTASEAAASLR